VVILTYTSLSLSEDDIKSIEDHLINYGNNRNNIRNIEWVHGNGTSGLCVFCSTGAWIDFPETFIIESAMPRSIIDMDVKYEGRLVFGCFIVKFERKNKLRRFFQLYLLNKDEEDKLMIIP